MTPIAIACDHAGREMKEDIKNLLTQLDLAFIDMGTDSDQSIDYPDFGIPLAHKVSRGEVDRGILICGTGIGMSILANKFKHVRAALVGDIFSTRMAREHNNANILVLGGRVIGKGLALEIVKTWLYTEFAGGRHQRRLDKIEEIEKLSDQ